MENGTGDPRKKLIDCQLKKKKDYKQFNVFFFSFKDIK